MSDSGGLVAAVPIPAAGQEGSELFVETHHGLVFLGAWQGMTARVARKLALSLLDEAGKAEVQAATLGQREEEEGDADDAGAGAYVRDA